MKDQFKENVHIWACDIEDKFKAWAQIGNQKEVEGCEVILEKVYMTIKGYSKINECKKLIIFNSKINSNR